jgi:hypothetical protein
MVIVEDHVATSPDGDSHPYPEPKRVSGVTLIEIIDAGLAANIVIGVCRYPEGANDVAACVPLHNSGFWVRREAPPTG